MTNFMSPSVVNYACSCGLLNPISKLFFCRHCLQLRCGFCVCHEVDSHFCSNCLENIPSAEARHKRNCCANCFDCPCCQHTLTPRATTVVIPKKPEDSPKPGSEGDASKVQTKKVYYLTCLSCRWTSRDVGIPDQSVATGAWPDSECAYQTRFNTLLEYFQAVVLQEKQERQDYLRRTAPKAHKYPSLTDRTGLTVSMIRRQMGLPEKTVQTAKPADITPAEASEDVEPLPVDIFTKKINLRKVTTIKQRHAQPGEQPVRVAQLHPQRHNLSIKRSLRCRQCEHNVIKPEYHPTSVRYRIQLFANYHMPDVLLVRCERPLRQGAQSLVVLKLTNPTIHDMTVSIEVLPSVEEEMQQIANLSRRCSAKEASNTTVGTPESLKLISCMSALTTASLAESPRLVDRRTNAQLTEGKVEFVLNHRDDSTEFDGEMNAPREEPDFILWRRANKIAVRLKCLVDEGVAVGEDVHLGFKLAYTYVNTVATNTPDKREPTSHELNARIYVKIGAVAEVEQH